MAGLLIWSAGASASPGHRYWTSFGEELIGGPAHVAVDDSDGSSAHDVYVADTSHYRVLKFSPEGDFILMFGDEVDATTGADVCTAASADQCKAGVPSPWEIPADASSPGFASPTELAVDVSAGPTAGDVYVVDRAHGRVLRFDPGGHRDTLWADEGELRTTGAIGVAVDPTGRLLVLEGGEGLVRTFDSSADQLETVHVGAGGFPQSLGVDHSGHLYVSGGDSEVDELAPNGSFLKAFKVEPFTNGFTVDGMTEEAFVSSGSGISSFSPACAGNPCLPSDTFGGRYGSGGDLAIDEVNQALYAISSEGVAVYLPASQVPEVTTGSAKTQGESVADLTGTIDPVGAPAVVACGFEYVTEREFEEDRFVGARSVPCDQIAPISSVTDLTGRIAGLERGTSYLFRVVAATADKTVAGFVERFTTPILPTAETGPVSKLGTQSVTLSGSLESPAGRPVLRCKFELVADHAFASDGFSGATWIPCAPQPFYQGDVEVAVDGEATILRPGSTYRYRIAVENIDGGVYGRVQSFTTLSVRRVPEERRVEPPEQTEAGPRPHPHEVRVRCTKKPCTRLLEGSPRARVWVSPRFPTSYGWLFEISVDGHPLHHTALENGCRSTFSGHGTVAKLNACHGRFRIVYRGSGSIRFRWRVFAQCRCAEVGRAGASAAPVAAPGR